MLRVRGWQGGGPIARPSFSQLLDSDHPVAVSLPQPLSLIAKNLLAHLRASDY
jgi:hypothetical protein